MGKGDIKKETWNETLIMASFMNPYVRHGAKLFNIPLEADIKEKEEILAKQVFDWLIYLSNKMDNYNKAIKVVNVWLSRFIELNPKRKEWVSNGAELGGQRFIKEVDSEKKKNKNQMINASIKDVFNKLFGG